MMSWGSVSFFSLLSFHGQLLCFCVNEEKKWQEEKIEERELQVVLGHIII
jgi:hypothetical protein